MCLSDRYGRLEPDHLHILSRRLAARVRQLMDLHKHLVEKAHVGQQPIGIILALFKSCRQSDVTVDQFTKGVRIGNKTAAGAIWKAQFNLLLRNYTPCRCESGEVGLPSTTRITTLGLMKFSFGPLFQECVHEKKKSRAIGPAKARAACPFARAGGDQLNAHAIRKTTVNMAATVMAMAGTAG